MDHTYSRTANQIQTFRVSVSNRDSRLLNDVQMLLTCTHMLDSEINSNKRTVVNYYLLLRPCFKWHPLSEKMILTTKLPFQL